MKRFLPRISALSLAIGILAAPAEAQDKVPPPSEFNADLGFVSVSGNTSVTTLSVGEKWIRRLARWEFKQDLAVVYGKTDGTETSNLWRASLRGDYGLGAKLALYA